MSARFNKFSENQAEKDQQARPEQMEQVWQMARELKECSRIKVRKEAKQAQADTDQKIVSVMSGMRGLVREEVKSLVGPRSLAMLEPLHSHLLPLMITNQPATSKDIVEARSLGPSTSASRGGSLVYKQTESKTCKVSEGDFHISMARGSWDFMWHALFRCSMPEMHGS